MKNLIEAIIAALFVIVLSSAFWSSKPIISILLFVFGGALIFKSLK